MLGDYDVMLRGCGRARGPTLRYTPGGAQQDSGREMWCDNYVIDGDTLYMARPPGPHAIRCR